MRGTLALGAFINRTAVVEQTIVIGEARVSRLIARECLWLGEEVGGNRGCDVRNCTIVGRVVTNRESVVLNSIVGHVAGPAAQIEHCNVFAKPPFQGGAKPGRGCFSGNPRFRAPRDLDYRLAKGSPCRGRASDGGDVGCRYTPEMIQMINRALELRKKGIIKF
jgi:hypothetical protein